jgi:acyl-coenzyme A synthetase/AMP-(fatty) acid ligase
MQPREIIWKDALPIGPNGKLDRTALKAELA